MSLKRLFWLVSIALMSLFLLLAAGLVATQWNTYRNDAEAVPVVRHIQLAMHVMEQISSERGPSNSVLGANETDMPAARAELEQARLNSDRSITVLLYVLRGHPNPNYPAIAASIDQLRTELATARRNIDNLAQRPLSARHSDDITDAANKIIALNRLPLVAITDLAAIATKADPKLRDSISSARLAASLREYAGQICTQFTAAVATHRPLRSDEVITISKLTGRAEQMRFILDLQLRSYASDQQIRAALDAVDHTYFSQGLPILNRLLQIGLQSGEYGLSTGALTALYVPKMKSIVFLRDQIMNDAFNGAVKRTERAKQVLICAIALAILALAVLYLLLRAIHTRVVTPVLESTRLFVALANGELETPIPAPRGADEISNLFRAMAAFKDSSIARISLEKEREALIAQLQATSDTDFLTGLMNRRAFFTQGQSMFANAQRYQHDLALILMDVDYFKQVNDDHGHQTGDIALQQVATLCRLMHRKGDIVVRYGGEEFLMLLPHTDLEQAAIVAEKLRVAIASQRVTTVAGAELRLSASFGVAAYANDNSLEAMIWRADKALYQAKNSGRNQVKQAV
ncbi:MAG TPA: GGDEF domain-containing protein [Herbaspirillum sp.]|jgi:diguanylate cyclase (GGDEF)-like protein|nr:GGDEF domain-containing protein [Herbaspirillum sp.]